MLRASLHAVALRWVLAAFLLLAQQGALTHALSHAIGHAHDAVAALHLGSHAASDNPTAQGNVPQDTGGQVVSGQCALDLVYSQVLGGMHAGPGLHVSASDVVAPFAVVARSSSITTRVPYDTRGPPANS